MPRDREAERRRKAAYRARKKAEREGLPFEVPPKESTGDVKLDEALDVLLEPAAPGASDATSEPLSVGPERPKGWVPAWHAHVVGVVRSAAREAADEESARRRREARGPRKPVGDTGSESEGPGDGKESWAARRRRQAVSYADFLIEQRASDPLYFDVFEYGLPPRVMKATKTTPEHPTTDREIEGFYGYYRREPDESAGATVERMEAKARRTWDG